MRLVLLGETGVGKDYLKNYIVKNYNIDSIVTYTTRPKRDGEKDGETYYFISKDEFLDKINNGFFLEYQCYETEHGIWFYGTPKDVVDKDNVVIILDKDGYYEYSKQSTSKSIMIYCEDETERFYRCLSRNKNVTSKDIDELYRRITIDRNKFSDIICDIYIPQLYTEDTLDVVDYELEKLGLVRKYDYRRI